MNRDDFPKDMIICGIYHAMMTNKMCNELDFFLLETSEYKAFDSDKFELAMAKDILLNRIRGVGVLTFNLEEEKAHIRILRKNVLITESLLRKIIDKWYKEHTLEIKEKTE